MVQQRTHGRTVIFLRPFALRGVDGVQPPGAYTVETEEELIEGLSFPAYRRKATVMLLPALDSRENRLAPDRHDRSAGAAGGSGARWRWRVAPSKATAFSAGLAGKNGRSGER